LFAASSRHTSFDIHAARAATRPGPIAVFATPSFADRNLTSSTARSAKAEDLLSQ